VAVAPSERPVRLVVRDDLRRSRLTVLLRFLLWIPHLVWLLLWGFAANLVAFILWLAVLIEGQAPRGLHDFVGGYVRYATHTGAYLLLAADRFPGFHGHPGYAIDVDIDPPARQSRWSALFRLILVLPALLVTGVLGGGFAWSAASAISTFGIALVYAGSGLAGTAAFLGWFAALARGRAPAGLRDAIAYALGYSAQTTAYMLLLTDRYPSSDPALVDPLPELPEHPVRIAVDEGLERSRLTIFFRLLLAIPHLVWITLWSITIPVAALAAWVVALVTGRVPSALHRYLAAYLRYTVHLSAFVYVVGRTFPGFTGREGSYPVDARIEGPERQSRWKTLFRLVLAVPAFLVASAFGTALLVVAILGWWVSLVLGRMPEGLRNLGASCLRYSAQTFAYVLLLTDCYPYASPVLVGRKPLPEQLVLPFAGPAFGDAS
jgi:hypothetical protein